MPRSTFLLLPALVLAAPSAPAAAPLPAMVVFNRDVRPILSDACFQCHGPDKARRKARLRLDTDPGSRVSRDGTRLLVAGRPDASELFRRITSADDKERM